MMPDEEVRPTPASAHGGTLGDVSKLLQEKAPGAVAGDRPTRPPPDDDAAAGEPTLIERAVAQRAKRNGDAEPEPELTAAQLEEHAAERQAERDADDQGDTDDATLSADADPAGKKITLAELAALRKVDPRRLYDDLRIPLADGGGTVTLAELRTGYQGGAEVSDARDSLAVDRQALTSDRQAANNEIGAATHLLAQAVGPDMVEPLLAHARKLQSATIEKGRTAILERFPEWKDPPVYDAARRDMTEHLAKFGITRAELESETDPRRIMYVHANMERDRRIAAAQAKIEKAQPPSARQRTPTARKATPSPGAARVQQAKARATRTGAQEDKNAAIAAVISRGR